MFTPLAKLAIGLSATMATAFYYLAAAPPASAQYCGSENFSSTCDNRSAPSPAAESAPLADQVQQVPVIESAPLADPVQQVPVVESAPLADPVQQVPVVESAPLADPVQQVPVVESAPLADPVQQVPVVESAPLADPVQQVPIVESAPLADPVPQLATEPALTAPAAYLGNIYPPSPGVKPPTAIPEPGTVVALLVTGAGIICCGRKRNKQVRQQR